MVREVEGAREGRGLRIAIVTSRFNRAISDQLLQGALRSLLEQGVAEEATTIYWVPGAFELPLVCARIASQQQVDAIVALGAVIRGETDHYYHVANQAADGLAQVALKTGVPIAFGVMTAHTADQARSRADPHGKNRGGEAALAALEMANLLRQLREHEATE